MSSGGEIEAELHVNCVSLKKRCSDPRTLWGISYATVFQYITRNPLDITVEGTHL